VHKAGKYALGSELSLVDIMLVPQVYNALRYEMDMTAYPLVNRIYQNCQKLAAFQRAAPENQSDAP
jgi:glutathione S-transferase